MASSQAQKWSRVMHLDSNINDLKNIRQKYKDKYAFLAFPSEEEFKVVVNAVIEVCKKKDILPYFVEYGIGSNDLIYDIKEGIKYAKYVIADETPDLLKEIGRLVKKNKEKVSRSNPNVMYEIGYAEGLSKTIILCVQQEHIKQLSFDIKTTRKIVYSLDDMDSFKEKLSSYLELNNSNECEKAEVEGVREHDIEIFKKIDSIICEDIVIEVFEDLQIDFLKRETLLKLLELRRFSKKESNSFLDSELESLVSKFYVSLHNLLLHIGEHFFLEKDDIHVLYPGWRKPENIEFIRNKGLELLELVRDSYKNFRRSVKNKLII